MTLRWFLCVKLIGNETGEDLLDGTNSNNKWSEKN